MEYIEYFCILIVLITIFFLYLHIRRDQTDVIYVISDIDNQKYLVRSMPDKQIASNMLATIKRSMNKLTDFLHQNINDPKYKDYKPYIEQLSTKIYGAIIMESSENSVYTSYSVNKGEEIIFCLRSRSNKNVLHSINLMMYVVLHEMSHVACPEYGHTDLFKKIFAFFAKTAIELNIYKKIDFNKEPTEYCGLMITDSII